MLNDVIALGIAALKASLVVWFFMHVRHGNPLLKIFVTAGFLWLIILILFTAGDYFTRGISTSDESHTWIIDNPAHYAGSSSAEAIPGH